MKNLRKNTISKRIIAWCLIVLMTSGLLNNYVFANDQWPIDSIFLTQLSYKTEVDGDQVDIEPLVSIRWEDPENWKPDNDPAEEHTPERYVVYAQNITLLETEETTIRIGSTEFDTKTVNLHDKMPLYTGSEYLISVVPEHDHDDGEANYSGGGPTMHLITDLQVDFEVSQDSVTVIWDNLNTANNKYEIIMKEGDHRDKTVTDLINNEGVLPRAVSGPGYDPEGEFEEITNGEGVTSYYDSIERRHKLSYTFDENLVPGYDYSFAVRPVIEDPGIYINENPNVYKATTNVRLAYIESAENLKFTWTMKEGYTTGEGNTQLTSATLWNVTDGNEVVKFEGTNGTVGYYVIDKPISEKEYVMYFYFDETYINDLGQTATRVVKVDSNAVTFIPSDINIVPSRPMVMELFTEEKYDSIPGTDLKTELENRFFLTPYNGDVSTYEAVRDALITYHLNADDNAINFVWSAFKRYPISEEEGDLDKLLTDLNVYYDITVTDTYDALPSATKFLENQRFGTGDLENLIKSTSSDGSSTIEGFRVTLDGYYEDATGEMKSIEPGKIYYIQIMAKKFIGDEEIESEEPTIVSLYYTETGEAYAPPLVPKPPLQVEDDMTTPSSVTIKWRQQWTEIINPTAASGDELFDWATELWVNDSGYSSTPLDNATYYPIFEDTDKDANGYGHVLRQLWADHPELEAVFENRVISLTEEPFSASSSAVKYRFYSKPYAEVLAEMEAQGITGDNAFTEYFYNYVRQDDEVNNRDLINWKEISPFQNNSNLEEVMYTEDGLDSNTNYLFILYPYRVLDDNTELTAHYPTPIIVATSPDPIDINPNPMVPNLYVKETTDTTVTVYWKYYDNFEYELAYSLTENIDDAKDFTFELPENKNDPEYPVDGGKNIETIDDLFPETGYYIFLRATNKETGNSSSWSNPVFALTDDVPIPAPPKGLGVAPDEKMVEYDFETAITSDSIAVQWLLDPADQEPDESSNVKVYYSYILEVANNDRFVDPIYIVSGNSDTIVPSNVSLLEKSLAKVDDLVSNRYYYFRIKTRVTVVGSGDGQLIIRESDLYSPTIRLLTVPSDNEYDSGFDPAVEILPSENFEVTYDPVTQELVYRFRDDEEGDNNVDQRLISSLINENKYSYLIDISNFDNKPIVKRKIQIPYSIIEAFDSFEIELKIDADKLLINIPHDALMDEVNRQKNQYGAAPTIEILIEDVDVFYDPNQMPEEAMAAVSIPQEVDIVVASNRTRSYLNYTDIPIELGLSTNNRYEIYGKEPVVYALSPARRWEEMEGSYDREEGAFMMSTRNIGSYGVFLTEGSKEIVSTVPSHWSESYKNLIDSRYTVLGLEGYNPDSPIPENEFINVCYSLALGESIIDVDQYISKKQLNELYYAGIKTDTTNGGSQISREEAIAMMTETILMRDGLSVIPTSSMVSAVNSMNAVEMTYKNSIAIAATMGIVSDINSLRPDAPLTYGEFFALWAKADE